MPKPTGERGNSANSRGHQAEREVYDAEGNRLEGITQTDWQNRNKDAGWTRPEDEVSEDVVVEPGVEEETPADDSGEPAPAA